MAMGVIWENLFSAIFKVQQSIKLLSSGSQSWKWDTLLEGDDGEGVDGFFLFKNSGFDLYFKIWVASWKRQSLWSLHSSRNKLYGMLYIFYFMHVVYVDR
jgi:hypothetical protein